MLSRLQFATPDLFSSFGLFHVVVSVFAILYKLTLLQVWRAHFFKSVVSVVVIDFWRVQVNDLGYYCIMDSLFSLI
jgi:hypothetical protein